MYTVAIVGRSNVGKSTLFNKLIGLRKAITHDSINTTRDYNVGVSELGDAHVRFIDTAGLYLSKKRSALENSIFTQTVKAIEQAQLLLFVVDAKDGLLAEDKAISSYLRRTGLPIILVINKSEGKRTQSLELYRLGYEEICQVSSEQGEGLHTLLTMVREKCLSSQKQGSLNERSEFREPCYLGPQATGTEQNCTRSQMVRSPSAASRHWSSNLWDDKQLRLAIIGRPNVGKSTLINALLQDERVITGSEAGTTRDAISIDFEYKGTPIELIDTAGLSRRKTNETLETFSVEKTSMTIKATDIVILVIDASLGKLEHQDLKIASMCIEEDKPLILVANKMDAVEGMAQSEIVRDEIEYIVSRKLSSAGQVSVVYTSALQAKNIRRILDKAIDLHKMMTVSISTSKLNKWLQQAMAGHPPPLSKSRRPTKLKYMVQIETRPPTFKIFSNTTSGLPPHYLKYLSKSLADAFGLHGIPIRIFTTNDRD